MDTVKKRHRAISKMKGFTMGTCTYNHDDNNYGFDYCPCCGAKLIKCHKTTIDSCPHYLVGQAYDDKYNDWKYLSKLSGKELVEMYTLLKHIETERDIQPFALRDLKAKGWVEDNRNMMSSLLARGLVQIVGTRDYGKRIVELPYDNETIVVDDVVNVYQLAPEWQTRFFYILKIYMYKAQANKENAECDFKRWSSNLQALLNSELITVQG